MATIYTRVSTYSLFHWRYWAFRHLSHNFHSLFTVHSLSSFWVLDQPLAYDVRYTQTSSFIGWDHTQNGPCINACSSKILSGYNFRSIWLDRWLTFFKLVHILFQTHAHIINAKASPMTGEWINLSEPCAMFSGCLEHSVFWLSSYSNWHIPGRQCQFDVDFSGLNWGRYGS